jgi:hypothetical protein
LKPVVGQAMVTMVVMIRNPSARKETVRVIETAKIAVLLGSVQNARRTADLALPLVLQMAEAVLANAD